MLTIYSNQDLVNRENLIISNDAAFNVIGRIPDNDIARRLISEIEHGKYLSDTGFITRNGTIASKNDLSTGTKTILNILTMPDKCISLAECGYNVLSFLKYIQNGSVLWELPVAAIFNDNVHVSYVDDNVQFDSLDEFLSYIESKYVGEN